MQPAIVRWCEPLSENFGTQHSRLLDPQDVVERDIEVIEACRKRAWLCTTSHQINPR
jgi:hypothetical protein